METRRLVEITPCADCWQCNQLRTLKAAIDWMAKLGGLIPVTLPPEGWGYPSRARKAHYFRETESLCRQWGSYRAPLDADGTPLPDECRTCRRLLDASQRPHR